MVFSLSERPNWIQRCLVRRRYRKPVLFASERMRVRGKDIGTSFEVEGEGEKFRIDLSQQGLKKHHRELEDVAAQKPP